MDQAQTALVAELRGQISDRVKAQHQLLLLTVAVLGAVISFQSGTSDLTPTVLATLSMLLVGIALAVLMQDQQIAITAKHLLDVSAFGPHADAQRRWEQHRFNAMQGGPAQLVVSTAMTVGIYGVPVLGAIGAAVAAAKDSPDPFANALLIVTTVLFGLFLLGSLRVAQLYRDLAV